MATPLYPPTTATITSCAARATTQTMRAKLVTRAFLQQIFTSTATRRLVFSHWKAPHSQHRSKDVSALTAALRAATGSTTHRTTYPSSPSSNQMAAGWKGMTVEYVTLSTIRRRTEWPAIFTLMGTDVSRRLTTSCAPAATIPMSRILTATGPSRGTDFPFT